MKPYSRKTPQFSLCGLNCCLCPRHHTDGPSRCPGCGGEDFHLRHPTCAVITCAAKKGAVEYCSDCAEYPCARYQNTGSADSFISYLHVRQDLEAFHQNPSEYLSMLDEKTAILKLLLKQYDDGRQKAFFCLAVNLLDITDSREVLQKLQSLGNEPLTLKEKAITARKLMEEAAGRKNISLKLRRSGEEK